MADSINPKHAYLIMAHTNFPQLQTLISLLDHPNNDSFGGYAMIMPEKFEYASVIKAMEQGMVYKSIPSSNANLCL